MHQVALQLTISFDLTLVCSPNLQSMKYKLFIFTLSILGASILLGHVRSAQQDREFDGDSGIEIKELSQIQHDNLIKLAKVWGFVKYYHPAVAKGDIDWDYELFRIMPAMLKANEQQNMANEALLEWIQRLGPFEERKEDWHPEAEVKLLPSTDWIQDQQLLGKDLSMFLQKIQEAKRTDRHHYIEFAPNIGNPIFNEKNYNLDYTDEGYKLLALFRYWNMIEYFFPYKHLADKDWDEVLRAQIPEFIKANDELRYKKACLILIGSIQDTHANIWQRNSSLDEFWGTQIVPIEIKYIEDQIVVTKILELLANPKGLEVGDIITHINDQSTEDLISEKVPYCPASNHPTQMRDICRKLLRTNAPSLKLTIKGKGSLQLKCVSFTSVNFWTSDTPAYQTLAHNIGYLYPGNLEKGEITKVIEQLKSTDGLIIDLRCYPSDFIVFSLGHFLVTEPTPFVKFTVGSLEMPGMFTFTEKFHLGNKSEKYRKPIVIIVNETTQSQAEYTTMAFQVAPQATVIGSTTAAADGNVSGIRLPGDVRTMISGIGVYYPDGTETQRVGIRIDEEVRPTIQGIQEGRDELLEIAMEIVRL